ncbi:recombinase family protein [Streptomyces sp. NPDC055099]
MIKGDQLVPVVAYARISADLERDGHGVEDQHNVNDETAAALGLRIVHYYTDNDLSAAKANVVRPDFEGMLKALKAGQLPDGQRYVGRSSSRMTDWCGESATTNGSWTL